MKFLYLNNFNYPRGGAENVFLAEAALLKNKDHSVYIFSRKHPENLPTELTDFFPSEMSTDSIRFNKKNFESLKRICYNVEAKRGLDSALNNIKIDLAHAHNIYGGLTTSVLDTLRNRGLPIVLTLHDYKLICPNYKLLSHGKICEDCKFKKYFMAIKNRCHKDSLIASAIYSIETYFNSFFDKYQKNIQLFISPSKFLKEKFMEFGWSTEKIIYLPNFIAIDDFKPQFPPGPYFIYIGRLSSEKGLPTLMKAFMEIKSPKAKLYIVGDGPIRKELEGHAHDDQRIHFTGYLSGNSLKEVTRNALAVVVPSEWYENAPLSVLEAFSFGKPVIGSKIGGIPEMIDEGYNGYLFNPGDVNNLKEKLKLMLSLSDQKIISMGKAGRDKIEKEHNQELHYKGLIEIYDTAIRML